MPVPAGMRFGPYEVVAPLGAGGMGEVYKARDTRLGRTVAIKILSEALARDPQFRERFNREARVISQLDHPHICPLYDVGDENGTAFLVMQYLEGETLADRLTRGALPLDQALRYAVEITDALDKSHRAGIVHRDLKPSNIFLTGTGAKLLDFGLAKTGAAGVENTSTLLTTPPHLTAQGTILGTFQYIAPEQLEGRQADARADIFAFGAVLYEMATGRKAFEGRSQATLIAAIMQADPLPISTLRRDSPPLLDHVVSRCLAKNRDDRWQTASDVMRELAWIARGAPGAIPSPATSTPGAVVARWKRTAYASGLLAVSLAAMVVYLFARSTSSLRDKEAHQLPVRVSVAPANNARLTSVQFAMSPDGTSIAYIGLTGQERQLWVYSVATGDSRLLNESDDVAFPFWSADSRHLGFFTNHGVARMNAAGGPIQTLAPAAMVAGGAWSDRGVVLFGGRDTPVIYRVSTSGGTAVPVTRLDPARGELLHAHPRFLLGGTKFLYWARSRRSDFTGVYVRSLDVDDRKLLVQAPTHAEYVAPGFLLFVRDSVLFAQRLDLPRLELQGEPFPVAQDVNVNVDNGGSAVSVSRDGSLVYHAGRIQGLLRWVDRQGHVIDTLTPRAMFREVELSADSRTALVRIMPKETTLEGDVWTVDVSRGISSRLTSDAGSLNARWARDGEQVLFDVHRGPVRGIYRRRSDGSGSEELVWKTEGRLADVSRDGHLLVEDGRSCTVVEPGRQPPAARVIFDLGKSESLTSAPALGVSSCGRFTDDMRLIAYTLDVSGRLEVYVVPFPEGAPRIQVSREGGREPRWRKDGRELFYLSADGTLMAVAITSAPTLQVSAPTALFRGATLTTGPIPAYSVARDGQRFLMVDPIGDPHADALTLTVHWGDTLRR